MPCPCSLPQAYESSQSQAAADLQRRIEEEKEAMAAARAERAKQEAARRQAEDEARRAAEDEEERVGWVVLCCADNGLRCAPHCGSAAGHVAALGS